MSRGASGPLCNAYRRLFPRGEADGAPANQSPTSSADLYLNTPISAHGVHQMRHSVSGPDLFDHTSYPMTSKRNVLTMCSIPRKGGQVRD